MYVWMVWSGWMDGWMGLVELKVLRYVSLKKISLYATPLLVSKRWKKRWEFRLLLFSSPSPISFERAIRFFMGGCSVGHEMKLLLL